MPNHIWHHQWYHIWFLTIKLTMISWPTPDKDIRWQSTQCRICQKWFQSEYTLELGRAWQRRGAGLVRGEEWSLSEARSGLDPWSFGCRVPYAQPADGHVSKFKVREVGSSLVNWTHYWRMQRLWQVWRSSSTYMMKSLRNLLIFQATKRVLVA